MPEPVGSSQRYMPGLDGLRALAVLAVVAYHLEFGWAQGGLLGVGVFFTLSGYLITDILLSPRARRAGLGSFWRARARRLLPALFVMLAVLATWVGLVGPAQPPQFRQAIAAAALYVSNWQLIFQHISYFARFGPPSPLGHLWSLGVEEQFYLLWPLLLAVGVAFVHEPRSTLRARPSEPTLRPRLAALTLLLAAGSAVEMALLYRPSFDPSRVYFGTDTRAFALLMGAALAMVWPSARLRPGIPGGARRTLEWAGAAGLLAIGVLVWRTDEYSPFLYRGGFVLLSLASACAIAVLVHPACRLGAVLGCAPLRWVGARSYGIYLWSLPIIALTTPTASPGIDLGRDALQVGAIFAVSALSWRFIEQPIRHGALGRTWGRLRAVGWRPHALTRREWAVPAAALGLLVTAAVALAAASPARESPTLLGSRLASSADTAPVSKSFDASAAADATHPTVAAGPTGAAAPAHTSAAPAALDPGAAGPGGPGPLGASSRTALPDRSSCDAVVDIGDSTSEGLVSPEYLPNPRLRIEAQYTRVGASVQHYEISGARSIVERYENQPNAYEAAQLWTRADYRGCWVLALGTNDTADVYVGSNVGRMARIERMMRLIGNQPVMWVNVKTLLSSGPYAEENMRLWNATLLQACRKYPNMRILDWAALAENAWFIDDGIHYNTPGYAARARLIAQGLAHAFPASGSSSGCLVD